MSNTVGIPGLFEDQSVFERLIGALPDETFTVPAGTWKEAGERAVFPAAQVYWADSRGLPVLLFSRKGQEGLKIVVTRVPVAGPERRETIWPIMAAMASKLDEVRLNNMRCHQPHLKGLVELGLDQVRADFHYAAQSDIDWSCWVRPVDSVAIIDCMINSAGCRFDKLHTEAAREELITSLEEVGATFKVVSDLEAARRFLADL